MGTLVTSENDSCWCCACRSYVWALVFCVRGSRWCCGCPWYMGKLISMRLRAVDAVAACIICGHWFPVSLIADDLWFQFLYVASYLIGTDCCWYVVAFVTCGHWFQVRHSCRSVVPCYMGTLISNVMLSHWPVFELNIYGHWFPVRLIAVELFLPLLYVDRYLQWVYRGWFCGYTFKCVHWFPVGPIAVEAGNALVLCEPWFPLRLISVDAVAAHFICGHWLTLRLISIDAVVALAIWGHWFPVRLIPVDLWWPSLQVDTDFLETISHWCYAFPIYKWTQMSIEIDRRFTVAALVICRHWFPVRLIAVDLCLPLIYLDTDFQWDR